MIATDLKAIWKIRLDGDPGQSMTEMGDAQSKRFYEQLKYPGPQALTTYLWARRLMRFVDRNAEFCFLDAGCGAGQHTAGILELFPNARAICLDQSAPSLELASTLIEKMGYSQRARFINASFSEPVELDEKVDIGVAIGALHHSPNIGASMKNVVAAIKPNGWFACMLYGERSHRRRYEIKEALDLVAGDSGDEAKLALVEDYEKRQRSLFSRSLSDLFWSVRSNASVVLSRLLKRKRHGYFVTLDRKMIQRDSYLNPIDQAIDTPTLRGYLEACNLTLKYFVKFDEAHDILPDSWKESVAAMETWNRIRVLELLDPRPQSFSFIAQKSAND